MRALLVSTVLVAGGLAGCTPGAITPLPTTPQGCVADYNAGKARLSSANSTIYTGPNTSGASALGNSLGKAMVRGSLEGRYNACMAQFGAGGAITDAQTYTTSTAYTQGQSTLVASQKPGSRAAMEACVVAVGIQNSYDMYAPDTTGAGYEVLAGANVSNAQAKSINTCIAQGAPVRQSVAPVPSATREDYVPETAANYSEYEYDCGTSVLVGGSGYCIKANQ